MFGNLLSAVQFPTGGGIQGLVYKLTSAIYSGGAVAYGVAIILFTLILRLIMLPLDFGNRYFTKKNSIETAKMKPDMDAAKAQYGSDFRAFSMAQQQIKRKHGYSGTGFMLFMLINLVVTLVVFISVFNALRSISNFNINEQYKELQQVYQDFETKGELETEDFEAAINEKYQETRVSFLWVHNIWRPDSWASKTLSWDQFRSAVAKVQGSVLEGLDNSALIDLKAEYEIIMTPITAENKGWNGILLLVLLAGVITYFSSLLNAWIMKKSTQNQPAPKEAEVGYSMREAKAKTNQQLPTIDPQMMGKIMKLVLPLIMVIFTISSTAALALYIITNSIIMTAVTVGLNYLVDWILKMQKKRKKDDDNIDEKIINPHAKYFKKKR